jgi:hypothetical protein
MTSTVLAGLLLRQPFQPFRGRLSHPLFNRRDTVWILRIRHSNLGPLKR